MSDTITDTVKTIARQVRALGVPHKALIAVDDTTLRVNHKTKGFVYNTDITYDRGSDLYNVTVHKIDYREYVGARPTTPYEVRGLFNPNYGDVIATRKYEGVYAESLRDVVGSGR